MSLHKGDGTMTLLDGTMTLLQRLKLCKQNIPIHSFVYYKDMQQTYICNWLLDFTTACTAV